MIRSACLISAALSTFGQRNTVGACLRRRHDIVAARGRFKAVGANEQLRPP